METHATLYAAADVEILRTGTFTAMDGRKVELSASLLGDIVQNYDPTLHEAKLVKGHTKRDDSDREGFGRITGLRMEGQRVLADFSDMSPDTALAISKRGMWDNRSAEITLDLDGKGPYLKNVSLLSARAPAIKGMARIEPNQIVPIAAFSEPEGTATYSYYFEEVDMPNEPTPSAAEIALSEDNKQKDIALAEANAKIAALSAKADKVEHLETIALASQAALAKADAKEFISQYPRRIVPAVRDIALACLCPDPTGEICLSESGSIRKVSSAEAFKAFIAALPDFGPALNTAAGDGFTPPDPDFATQPNAEELAFAARVYPVGTEAYNKHIEQIKKDKGGSA